MKIPKQAPLFGISTPSLRINEVFYNTGELQYRFSQKSINGTDWINEGSFEEYYQNGCFAKKGFFLNGKKNGYWKEYHENGTLFAEGYYQNDKQSGEWKEYYENKITARGNYNNGKKQGIWKYYDKDGKLKDEKFYN